MCNIVITRFWRSMYHQFDRSMHPRQSILKTILTLKENSRKAESTLQALESVSTLLHIVIFLSFKLDLNCEYLNDCMSIFNIVFSIYSIVFVFEYLDALYVWNMLFYILNCHVIQRLQQLGVVPVATSDPPAPPPTRDQLSNSHSLPPRPDSLILGAPINHKEVQRHEEEDEQEEVGEEATESTDTERTVEGSSGTESRKQSYGELEGTYNSDLVKEEPAVVSLEFGVARMTC